MSVTPRPLELTEVSKMRRYIKNTKILQMLKIKMQQNPQKLPQILQAFVKVNLSGSIYSNEHLQGT